MIKLNSLLICLLLSFYSFTLEASPKRIISTSPVITEFISFLGQSKNLIAVSNYCKNKQGLPTIGSSFGLDYEQIVSLNSDILFLESVNDTRVKEKLKKLNINYVELKFLTIRDIKESSYKIAKKLGLTREKLYELFYQLKPLGNTGKKVLIVLGEDTSSNFIKTIRAVSGNSFYSNILGLVGGINILHNSSVPYPILDLEKLMSLNPDIIIRIGQNISSDKVKKIWAKTIFKDKVKFMMDDTYLIPGPQILKTYTKMRDIVREAE
ncbi:MAG: ABC transporter substrate-binding protein [Bdellovibrionota bacterium]|nr:ABC transporter substrate-binding protein [Bdellovibrionota bacterium]